VAITQRGLEPETAADALIDGYVAWREAADDVQKAYERWATSALGDRHCSFAGYLAALDREQHASQVYVEKLERLRLLTRRPRDARAIRRTRRLRRLLKAGRPSRLA
jgi:hypothetical protein